MDIPATLRAGDTYSWTESNSDYPASSSWKLAIVLQAKDRPLTTITASANGTDHNISIPVGTSKDYAPGTYLYQAYFYKETDGTITEKHTVETGQIVILPNLTSATSEADFRSHAKKSLDAIEALLEGKTTGDVLSYSIAGRSISKMSPTELTSWRDYYLSEYQEELDEESIDRGGESSSPVKIGFNRV